MFTPDDLVNYKFQTTGRNSYNASDVDDFMDQITEDYDQLFKENKELVKRIGLLADKLQEYKNSEDSINTAIITAEKMKEQIISEANETAERTIKEAHDKVDGAYDEAREKAKVITEEAEAQAKIMEEKAQKEYDLKIGSIVDDIRGYETKLEALKREATDLKQTILDLCDSLKDNVNSIEDYDFSKEEKAEEDSYLEQEVEEAKDETADESHENRAFGEYYKQFETFEDNSFNNTDYYVEDDDQKTKVFDV